LKLKEFANQIKVQTINLPDILLLTKQVQR